MKKTFTLILITIFSIAAIYALVRYVRMDGFAFAWALSFLLMLCVSVFTEALKSPLTSAYYEQKEWERKGKIYESLGINFFRKLLVWSGWEKVIRKSFPIENNTSALTKLYYQTKKGELDHLIILLIVLGFNIFVAFSFGVVKSLWLLGLNVFMNLYPIFLQRYNRPRVERAMNLSKRRQHIPVC
ncbi:hypothetical protein SAMN04488128_106410 [Chitinophaga eiseniae]|uniref:Glycosyl-4,4'-diaponeurosporenoate acyltransferase n=1 Tax=Chitinophaga eiseniae TaxID=634771 RepID=A0A1T4TVK0_9BACT|nr:hypothetical protein [Chitinophaga eiseniae]SKA44466.1 hypothetical protein SAMN04488128_106410 [Chitinophaga eiseniae]